MTTPPATPKVNKKQAALTAFIAGAVVIGSSYTAKWEGLRLRPYKDVGGVPTVCYGQTKVEMRVYSNDECGAMLRQSLMKTYGPVLADCLPELVEGRHGYAFYAFLDASYNAGPNAVCKSPMAAYVRSGNLAYACFRFRGWRTTAKRRVYPGLVARRNWEASYCLKDVGGK